MRQERIVLQLEEPVNVINFASITGYVTAVYDGFWWVACVVKTFPESEEIEVFCIRMDLHDRSDIHLQKMY